MGRRRRTKADALTVILWRDIPAQITASVGGATGKALLEARFQHAIDRAAAVADLTETSAYVSQWRRIEEPITGAGTEPVVDPDAAATARAEELSDLFPRDRLEAFVANGGLDPNDSDQR